MSGGEPLVQPHFVTAVFKRVHDMGLTTCLDTACHGDETVWDEVLPHTDNVLLCLKGMDNDLAAEVAGVTPEVAQSSKDFALFIRDKYSDIKLSLRWVLIDGMTDSESELKQLAAFAKELAPVFTHVELIPYHELGRQKYASLNRPYPLDNMVPYSLEGALYAKAFLENLGVKTTLTMI
jgi:pyruvate formate lyase activating enzyme